MRNQSLSLTIFECLTQHIGYLMVDKKRRPGVENCRPELKLPADHGLRQWTPDFQLYLALAEFPEHQQLATFAYAYCREFNIPTECVSKVLIVFRRYEQEELVSVVSQPSNRQIGK